jgi:hypothetical protein
MPKIWNGSRTDGKRQRKDRPGLRKERERSHRRIFFLLGLVCSPSVSCSVGPSSVSLSYGVILNPCPRRDALSSERLGERYSIAAQEKDPPSSTPLVFFGNFLPLSHRQQKKQRLQYIVNMMMMMMSKNLLGVWLLLSSLTHVMGGPNDGKGYMYGTRTAAIQEYSATTGQFDESTHPRVVEFYDPSCVSSQRRLRIDIVKRQRRWKIQ